jgi:biopolymer transport protein ExbB
MGTLPASFGDGASMPLVVAAGVLSLIVILERLYAIVFRARSDGRAFIERSLQLVRSGKVEDAIKLCSARRSALADVGLVLLRGQSRDETHLGSVAGAAILALVPRLRNRLVYLPALAVTALLLAVLSFTIGLHSALHAAATAASPEHLPVAAAAMIPHFPATFLAIAIASADVLAYAYLSNQSEFVGSQMREYSARLINLLTGRPDVRLGHR